MFAIGGSIWCADSSSLDVWNRKQAMTMAGVMPFTEHCLFIEILRSEMMVLMQRGRTKKQKRRHRPPTQVNPG
jgi:hypothetical protein